MNDTDIAGYADLYRRELFARVIPFWEKYSIDAECGGYFTSLMRDGRVYDTDKFVWLQARQVWMFSALYSEYEQNQRWLDVAAGGADFLRRCGTDEGGNWYFALDRAGKALVQPYNIFSDCFAAMAFCRYGLAAGDDQAKSLALSTYHNILKRADNPKGAYNKTIAANRPMKSLALPMILANLTCEMAPLLDGAQVNNAFESCVSDVVGLFVDKERGLVFENVSPDGSHPDCFEGRLINPGHGIEAMWFIMDIAQRRGDRGLIDLCLDIVLKTLEFAWDGEYGGVYYFLDVQGRPPVQLEWSQKLWWVHLETLVALVKGYSLTGRAECLEWFEKVHEYAWSHFSDERCGEWFGYLDRRGELLSQAKGGKWKGCFHVPRGLYLCYMEFEKMKRRLAGDCKKGE